MDTSANEIEYAVKTALGASSRREAVRALAARVPGVNRGKLCRRLHTLLDTGEAPPALIETLRGVLGDDTVAFDAALEAVRRRRDALAQSRAFARRLAAQYRLGVHVWVEHARRRPSQITVVAMTGLERWKTIGLPEDLPDHAWQVQADVVQLACRDWLETRGRRCPLFGHVTGFVYRPNPWSSYRSAPGGRLCAENLGPWGVAGAQWSVK